MQNNYPLQNPELTDFTDPRESELLETIHEPVSSDQLVMDIDTKYTKLKQFLNNFKSFIKRRNDILEVSQVWKNPSFPFAIISSTFTILTFFFVGIFRFDKINPEIPIIYDSVENKWIAADKSVMFIFPIILAGIEIIIINFCFRIFRTDRRLAFTISWILTFLNALLLIALAQIQALII